MSQLTLLGKLLQFSAQITNHLRELLLSFAHLSDLPTVYQHDICQKIINDYVRVLLFLGHALD